MADNGGYHIGDVANGYVLTEHGWQPVQPADATQPITYRVGDVANGYVLTEHGWTPVESPATPPPAGPSAYPGAPAYPGQPAGQPAQPAYQPAPGTGTDKRLLVTLVVVAVVVLGAIGAASLALINTRNNGRANAPVSSSTAPTPSPTASTDTSTDTSTGTPTDTPTTPTEPSTTTTPASEGKAFVFGEVARLTYDRVEAAELTVGAPVEFTPTNAADRASRGRFVYVPVTIKVTGKNKVTVNPFDFNAVLPDGEQLEVAFVADLPKNAPAELNEVEINPGQTLTGSIPFDVPANTPLKIAYVPDNEVLGTWK